MIEEEHIVVVGSVLDVHHIDYNKKNNKENNLLTLCRFCHTRTNFNRNTWIVWFKEEWHKGVIDFIVQYQFQKKIELNRKMEVI